VKVVKKISKKLITIQKAAINAELPVPEIPDHRVDEDKANDKTNWKPISTTIQDELDDAGDEVTKNLKERQRELINSLDLQRCVLIAISRASVITPDNLSDTPLIQHQWIGKKQKLS
jgi:hypothetical protein